MVGRLSLLVAVAALVWPVLPAVAEDSGERVLLAQARAGIRGQAQKRMTGEKYMDIHGHPGNGPKYGEEAPDFALMPLKFYEFGIDDTEITEETAGLLYEPVRLSDFRGKKPVVLIFGSYT